jgi:hypothetical protein
MIAVQSVYIGSGLGPLREPAGALERTVGIKHQIHPGVKRFEADTGTPAEHPRNGRSGQTRISIGHLALHIIWAFKEYPNAPLLYSAEKYPLTTPCVYINLSVFVDITQLSQRISWRVVEGLAR